MIQRFRDHVAIVTGASGGIGRSICRALAVEGARVCITGRDQQRLTETAELCRPFSEDLDVVTCDLSDVDSVDRLTEHVVDHLGRLDVLIHSAGAIGYGRIAETDTSWLDLQYAANVRGPLKLTQNLLPLLRQPRGQVAFINSSAGLSSAPGRGHFSATQHAIRSLTDTLRQEVNDDGIRVLGVYPGRTATPRTAALYEREGRHYDPDLLLQPDDVAAIVIHALALPWTAEVTDIHIRSMRNT